MSDWKDLFNIITKNIIHKSPKVSWNCCVLLRKIMSNDYVREKVQDLLFSEHTIKSLCLIICENSNFKTRIHAVQTLNKFRNYHDFGSSNLEVWNAFLYGFQNVTLTTDFTEVKYISTLEYQLVSLLVTLVQMVEENESFNEKFSIFLNDRSREIEACLLDYLRKQFKITAFSTVYDEQIDLSQILDDKSFPTHTIKQLQIASSKITKIIDNSTEIQLPFSVYQTFTTISTSNIADLACSEILKLSKPAFDQQQF